MRHDECSRRWISAACFVLAIRAFSALVVFCLSGCSPGPPAHGTAFVVALTTNEVNHLAHNSNHLLHARDVLHKRLDSFGVNFSIEPATQERLLIKLPNMDAKDLDAARKLISRPWLLEFRMVHKESAELLKHEIIEPGHEVLKEGVTLPNGRKHTVAWLVRKSPERGLTGKYVRRASVSRTEVRGAPQINFEFDQTGAKLFEQITTEYQPARGQFFHLAIVLDGELQVVPRIEGVISGGRGVISGNFTVREAVALAAGLENPLEIPLLILEEKSF